LGINYAPIILWSTVKSTQHKSKFEICLFSFFTNLTFFFQLRFRKEM